MRRGEGGLVYDQGVIEEEKYLVAFASVPNIGSARLKLLLDYFGSAQKAWEADERVLEKVGLPKDALADFLEQRKKLKVDEYLQKIIDRGIKVVTFNDKNYPGRLKDIPSAPLALFIKSNLTLEQLSDATKGKIIAVVGTRKITAYGREVTEMLTSGLVVNGFTVVSGLALGVDGVAHGTALNCGGTTIAVLGTGVDVIYPREHKELYNSILEHGGAIVSEVAPEKTVVRGVFPARNRIISGLSQAVLVTEGAIDSGSLITARAALDQGREVFAVPGPINSIVNEGTNYLLKNGAKLVSSVEDIVSGLGYEFSLSDQSKSKKEKPMGDNKEEQDIIDLLINEAKDFDWLVRESGMKSGQLAALLSELEVKGKVRNSQMLYRLS